MRTKTIVIVGICAIGLAIYGIVRAKTAQAKRLFERVMFSLNGISGTGISDTSIWLKLNFAITNPTAEDFYIDTNGAIQVKVMRMYLGGEQIGFASVPDFYQLDLRAGRTAVLRDVRIEIGLLSLAPKLYSSIAQNKTDWAKYTELLTKLSFEMDIDAFGQIYTFKQSFS